MDILILGSLQDLQDMFLGRSLLLHIIKQYEDNGHNVKVYSKYTKVRNKINPNNLLKELKLDKALEEFKKEKESFLLVTKLAISNIDYEKLLIYHKNHNKDLTLVCRNLVKGKATPVYQLNESKEIIGVNKKRYASCGIYLFNSKVNFKAIKTLTGLVNDLIEERNIKAFVHTGYYFRKKQEFDGVKHVRKRTHYIRGGKNGKSTFQK